MKFLAAMLAALLFAITPAAATDYGACLRDKDWLLANGANALATVADVESTFAGIEGDPTHHVHEGNFIVAPFVKRGRLATYGFEFLINGLIAMKSCDWKQDPDPFYNRYWFIAPSVMAGGHALAFGLNLRFVH